MQSVLRDFRFGLRSLRKSPTLTAVATLALTFGIGITTMMFSIVYGVMLHSLPFPDGERIVMIYRATAANPNQTMTVPIADYADFAARQHSLSAIAAYYSGTVNVSGVGQAERYTGAWATASMFDVAKVRPILGRTFRPEETAPNGPKVALISYGMWKTRFGGQETVLGQVLRANGEPFTIVGVLPEKYAFPDAANIWLPLQMDPLTTKRGDASQQFLRVVGLIKPDVSLDQASLDFATLARNLALEYKATNENFTAGVKGFIDASLGAQPKQLLRSMLAAVFLVLLVACANVANLLLDRAAHKTKEVGIRTALGASRTAIVRQFLTEAFVLSAAGAIGGTVLAYFGIGAFTRQITENNAPFFLDIRLHPAVLAFVVALALVSTLLSGLIPAIQSSRTDINEVLKDGNRGSSNLKVGRMSRVLVVAEIALSCGLLVASGLMVKTVARLNAMDPGFRTHNIFTARLGFPATYTDTIAQQQFMAQLRDGLAAIPGVRAAAIMSYLPGVGSNSGPVQIEGASYAAPRDVPTASSFATTQGYFETFDVKPLSGRVINANDRADAPFVVVVDKAFADRFFAGQDAIGRRIRGGGFGTNNAWMTIVGVVPSSFSGDLSHPQQPTYYQPLSQHHSSFVSLAVQVPGDPMAITAQVRDAAARLNADIPLYRVYSMDEALAQPLWYVRTFGALFMIFGVIALFLAATGLYAVMSFSVSRRTREVGIRMALGAQAGQVIGMVLRQGAAQLAIGLFLGLGLAAVVGQATALILFEVEPRDPQVFGGVIAVLLAAGLVACVVPARRATRVDPLAALRSE